MRDCLTHASGFRRRIAHIERQKNGAADQRFADGHSRNARIRVRQLDVRDEHRGELAGPHLIELGLRAGNILQNELRDSRTAAEVGVVTLKPQIIAVRPCRDAIRTAAYGCEVERRLVQIGDAGQHMPGQNEVVAVGGEKIRQDRGVRRLEFENDRQGIRSKNPHDAIVSRSRGNVYFGIHDLTVCVRDVGGRERRPVLPPHVFAQMIRYRQTIT